MLKVIGAIVPPLALLLLVGLSSPISAQSLDPIETSPLPAEGLEQEPALEVQTDEPSVQRPIESQSIRSTSLDFNAALQAISQLRSLPKGTIRYQGWQGRSLTERNCWVVDAAGRRIDLSSLCSR